LLAGAVPAPISIKVNPSIETGAVGRTGNVNDRFSAQLANLQSGENDAILVALTGLVVPESVDRRQAIRFRVAQASKAWPDGFVASAVVGE
jgi:hypothetical protein